MKKNKIKIFNIKYLILFFLIFSSFSVTTVFAFEGGTGKLLLKTNNCSADADCKDENKYCSEATETLGRNCFFKKETGIECGASNECKGGLCEVGQGGKKYCVNPQTGEGKVKWAPIAPVLQINIPTLQPFTTAGMTQTDSEGNIYIPFIGQYIAGIYKWAVGIAGLVAAVLVIIGGFMYLTSGGNAQRAQQGKERLTQALLGLGLLLGSYLLLYTINPDLVSFKSLKIKVIERKELTVIDPQTYQKITGTAVLPKPEAVKKAIEAGQSAGLDDPCYMVTTLAMESGARPNVIGHDENAGIAASIPSRKNFLISGQKKSGKTFTPPATATNYDYKIHNSTKILNDDVIDPNKPDLGLDWRFSHGFGLGQITIFPGEKCNGLPGKIFPPKNGQCYTIKDLLLPEKNLFYSANLFKNNLQSASERGLTGEVKTMAAFLAYNAGSGRIKSKKFNPNDLPKVLYVQKAMGYYNTCKQNLSNILQQPIADITEILPPSEDEEVSGFCAGASALDEISCTDLGGVWNKY